MIRSAVAGGWEYDAVWNDDFHHSLHVLLTGERQGYYEDYSGVENLASCIRDGFLYAGRYSNFRQMSYGRSSKDNPAKRFVVFSQNHDQIGNRRMGDRLVAVAELRSTEACGGNSSAFTVNSDAVYGRRICGARLHSNIL